MKKCTCVSLPDDDLFALEANRPCNNDYVLAWKRAQPFLLLGAIEDPEAICRMFNIDPSELTEWICAYSADGLSSFGLKDYS